jgi:hypothetical protein
MTLPELNALLLLVENSYADALGAALPLLRDPATGKAASEALAKSPERMAAALESTLEIEHYGEEVRR